MTTGFTPDERCDLAEALTACMALYKHQITLPEIRLWLAALADLPAAAIVRALGEHVRDPDVGQYQPKPADVVRKVRGGTATNAAWAWAEVQRAAKSVGGYRSVVFSDPTIHLAIEGLGGWVWLTEQPERDLPFIGKRFADLYTGARSRLEVSSHPRKLIGRAEADNASNGHARIEPPVLIGDARECMAVLETGRDGGLVYLEHAGKVLAGAVKELSHAG